jgi:hypothetical protein
MITLQMTEDEAKVFLVMLEQAADEFSNHGCNDFDVAAYLKLDKPMAVKVAKELRAGMFRDKILGEEDINNEGIYLYDWTIFSWLKKKIQKALTSPS